MKAAHFTKKIQYSFNKHMANTQNNKINYL